MPTHKQIVLDTSNAEVPFSYEERHTTYQITITFDTDRTLTEDEVRQLVGDCLLQVEEPLDANRESAEFTTRRVKGKFDSITTIL